MEGLSGKIKFDGAGFRSDFQLDIVELKREGLVQVSTGKKYFKSYKNICRSALGTRAMEPISPVTTRKYPTRLWRVFITRLWLCPPSWWVADPFRTHGGTLWSHYEYLQSSKTVLHKMLQCAPMTTGPLWCSALYRIIWCWCYLQNAPFLMLKEKSETLTGNARYEGYSVDLISSISEILGQTWKWCLTMFRSHSDCWKILSKENDCQSQRKL